MNGLEAFGHPALALPRAYLLAMEGAREPGATQRERALAHIIDALLVVILCQRAEGVKGDKKAPD
jgi:hypothetical protein